MLPTDSSSAIAKQLAIIDHEMPGKYLYEYCHMNECRNIAYEHYRAEKEAGYYPDMSVSEHAEMIALEKYSNGKYPDTFPWLV
jgi:hypothetical protein